MPRFDQGLIRAQHIVSSWTMVRLERSGQTFVLQVATDLAFDAMDPVHGEPAVSDLLETIRAFMKEHPIIDSAEINTVVE